MPTQPCQYSTPCIDPSNPLTNYSSEAPDPLSYFGISYPFINPDNPVENKRFWEDGCLSLCESTVSQEDADLCAARQAVICANTPPPDSPDPTPTFFYSKQVTLQLHCPDGNPFGFVLAAGAFVATSQAYADQQALAYALEDAPLHMVCLSSVTPSEVAARSSYSGTIVATGKLLSDSRNSWVLVGGVLPPGVTIVATTGTTLTLTGVPTVAGSYSFAIRFTSRFGDYMVKNFTICVLDITPTTLPNASTSSAYNQTLSATGCAQTPLEWTITSGALPGGLTLDPSSGVISGTPTNSGTFNFTVTLQTSAT